MNKIRKFLARALPIQPASSNLGIVDKYSSKIVNLGREKRYGMSSTAAGTHLGCICDSMHIVPRLLIFEATNCEAIVQGHQTSVVLFPQVGLPMPCSRYVSKVVPSIRILIKTSETGEKLVAFGWREYGTRFRHRRMYNEGTASSSSQHGGMGLAQTNIVVY